MKTEGAPKFVVFYVELKGSLGVTLATPLSGPDCLQFICVAGLS